MEIEEYFRVLKSGCKIENSRLSTKERLEKLIALKSIIAFKKVSIWDQRAQSCKNLRFWNTSDMVRTSAKVMKLVKTVEILGYKN
ncbi:MAG: hypothetical protein ACRY3E_02625 [Candidatus Lariskella arthropodorum]